MKIHAMTKLMKAIIDLAIQLFSLWWGPPGDHRRLKISQWGAFYPKNAVMSTKMHAKVTENAVKRAMMV